MKAMILAAGRGERLRPLTDRVPKPMIPVGGEPLIVHQLGWLRRAGITEVVVNVHHLAAHIEQALGDGAKFGVRIRYSREPALLDTGGGILQALDWLRPGPFVVLNGDIWTDYGFARLRPPSDAIGHLVLTPTPAHRKHGDFHLDGDRVRRGEPERNDLTYCGIAALREALFDNAPAWPFSLRELYFDAAAAGELTGERFAGRWIDIGTPAMLERAQALAR